MRILTLNCQKAYQPTFEDFLIRILKEEKYNFILLQEVNSTVRLIIDKVDSSYKILDSFDAELGEKSHVYVLYKNDYIFKNALFISFANLDSKFTRRGWGFVGGLFAKNNKNIFVGSVHLHPGFRSRKRLKQVKIIKQKILEKNKDVHTIIGGDFNTGLPFEIYNQEKVFSPELVRITNNLAPTLDSRYTEKTPFFITKVANFLASIGISIKFRADHIYISKPLEKYSICKMLPDRVSDHNPVELSTEFA